MKSLARKVRRWFGPGGVAAPPAKHLRLNLAGHASTSIALVTRKAGWARPAAPVIPASAQGPTPP